jgi:uncharacterized DUF497 family protein
MRFRFSRTKSEALQRNPRRGIGFDEAQGLFAGPHYIDRRSDDPEQFRAIGWCQGRLYSVIFEVREDGFGEYFHLVTLWRSTVEEQELYEANS